MTKLFIDDIRNPEDAGFRSDEMMTVVRDYEYAMRFINQYKPQYIAFDHDLTLDHYSNNYGAGGEKTGYDIAVELIDLDKANPDAGYITKDFRFSSHSGNPRGKKRIEHVLTRYYYQKFGGFPA